MGVLVSALYGNITVVPRAASGSATIASDNSLTVTSGLAPDQATAALRPAALAGSVSYRLPTSASPGCLSAQSPPPPSPQPPPAPAALTGLPPSSATASNEGELLAALGIGAISTVVVTSHIALSGEVVISRSVTVQGSCDSRAGAAASASPPVKTACRLTAAPGSRAVRVAGATVTLSGLVITGGNAGASNGGGVWCTGGCVLTANDVAVTASSASSGAQEMKLFSRAQQTHGTATATLHATRLLGTT